MHPSSAALAGLLILSCVVIRADDVITRINGLHDAGELRQDLPSDTPFWWMNNRSPFKRESGGCANGCAPTTNELTFSANPFLTGRVGAPAGFAVQTVNPSFPGSPTGSHNGYLPPNPQPPRTVPCLGQGQVCVVRHACASGFVLSQDVAVLGRGQECNVDTEVCCAVRVPTTTPRPTTTQLPPTPCVERNYFCVAPQACRNGVIVSQMNNLQPVRQCYSPQVCCRFVQEPSETVTRPSVTLPPYPKLPNEISDSTVLTDDGYVIKVPDNQYLPQREPSPDSQNPIVVPAPTTTFRPVPSPTTPQYLPPPPSTARPYVPPVAVSTTARPVVIVPSSTPQYLPPYKGDQYIPPVDREGEPSNPQSNNILPPTTRRPRPPPQRGENQLAEPIVPSGCPAAMNCTEYQYCDVKGVITTTPVVLTKEQELFRVPLTDCVDRRRGFQGKCCRDPNYVDPWPVGQLGQYNPQILNAAFDDGSYRPEKYRTQQNTVIRGQSQLSRPIAAGASTVNRQVLTTQQSQHISNNVIADRFSVGADACGTRNLNTQPRGAGPLDTGFGEFPWQAMVLLETNRSLLCGGAIIERDVVVTAAHCVSGLPARSVMIKAGEWRLGVDEEPKTFQIVRVKAITLHPAYNPTNLNSDVALLHLEEKLRYDTHIGPICVDDEYVTSASTTDCVTTGWGKEVLRINIQNALMHSLPVTLLSDGECQAALSGYGFNSQTGVCGRPRADACEVDVGSALACSNGKGGYVLRGVYSTETECASSNQVVSFARVDTQWLRQALSSPQPQPTQTVQIYEPQPNSPQRVITQGPAYLPPHRK
ncbi:inactive serine protease scarface [Phlebotomus argentipes]|uniref:inactive serine protease scarface n=1 Tax=Phlebotomus argentipes TaxID=94469 RepID=UPI002892E8DA|nr:inactive serine protease scarface [Phlebotomus argentipes]